MKDSHKIFTCVDFVPYICAAIQLYGYVYMYVYVKSALFVTEMD